ncbi:tripartite ATP-independent periplasmic transporter DctQ component [Candidatus Vecturithrix granuli]|uniref:Tripartite ATP-independent periplasmic transporter DctQ component n=1 Tax=Vecturithrix granuli TaxID=1499967 RepID=A0A081BWY3_VECG1|nr:tripartite ATP-independent periplasmic transporter DctQ component [Candidatus Vecturithrix granuli]
MRGLHQIERVLTAILEGIVGILFFGIVLITATLVLLRYGFNSTIIGGDEAISYLFIYTTAIGAAVAMAKREHINIAVFVEKLPKHLQIIVDSVGLVLVAFLNGVMIWKAIPWIKSVGGFESPVLRIPMYLIQSSVPMGCALVILYCLYHLLVNIFEKRGAACSS